MVVWPEGANYGGMTPDRIDTLLDSIAGADVVAEWQVPEEEVGMY